MKLTLNKQSRRARVRHGHPWVFAGELESLPPAEFDGKALPLYDEKGRLLGTGIVNTRSQIVWRRFSRDVTQWDVPFWRKALQAALLNRDEEPFRRLVWSESDDLPGLVVDQFDHVLVVQALTLAVDLSLPKLLPLLQELFDPEEILVRNDAPTRKLEGLAPAVFTASGRAVAPFWGEIYRAKYYLDLANSQKTGFYLDQRHEHFKVATLAEDWRVLDTFCNQGAFAINCAMAGAREVIGIDSSADAIRLARQNAKENRVEVDFREANVFDYFTQNRDQRFDLIVLDPPSFAPNKRAVAAASKGYNELNLRALRMLNEGGILATYCCSHHVDRVVYRSILEKAAADARRKVQILYETGQPGDHPVVLNFPESEYLKGFILRMLD